MSIQNHSFSGFRQFCAGILANSNSLGDWFSNRLLESSRVNLTVTIGGNQVFVETGSDLLAQMIQSAKQNKLTKEEADVIASELDKISFRYDHQRTWYYVEFVEKQLTNTETTDKMEESKSVDAVVETKAPAQRGRKPTSK